MSALRVILLMALVALPACEDGITSPPRVPVRDAMSISPAVIDLRVGETTVVRISGVSTVLTALWYSDNPDIASVAPGGFVRGNQPGTTYITARVGDQVAAAQVIVRGPEAKQ
jgi:hypothetical protein